MSDLKERFKRRRVERRAKRLSTRIASAEAQRRREQMERDDRIVAKGTEGGAGGSMG
jgi:hypothetical protein